MAKTKKGENAMDMYHSQTAKFLATVAQSMPEISGKMMQKWIEDPVRLGVALREIFLGSWFKTWKTLKLGTAGLKTADDFRKAIKDRGMKISDWADDILGRPTFSVAAEETEIELVLVTVAELGFKNRAARRDIYKRAQELGLELCPAEVGPQLRLQHKDQPNGEWIPVAMEPIPDSDGSLLCVGHDVSDLWLCGKYGGPDTFWCGASSWAFARRK